MKDKFAFAGIAGDRVMILTTQNVYVLSIADNGTLFAETCPRPTWPAPPAPASPVENDGSAVTSEPAPVSSQTAGE